MAQPQQQAMDPLTQCLAALNALYGASTPPEIHHQADQWLIQFQVDPRVWTVADQILHRTDLKSTQYFFAANTLLLKLEYMFNELTEPAHRAAFKASLLTHCQRFAACTEQMIKTKLAQAVACLTVHLIGLGEWPNAISELINMFNKDQPLVLLDILSELVQENHNYKLFISREGRARAQREIMKETEQVLRLLMHYLANSSPIPNPTQPQQPLNYISSGILNTPNTGAQRQLLPHVSGVQKDMHTKILTVFKYWVKYSGDGYQFTPSTEVLLNSEHLINHPLILFCFKIIASRCGELEQIAMDVLCSFLRNLTLVSRTVPGGFRGFRSAGQQLDEDENGGGEEGEWEPQGSPTNGNGSAQGETSQYQNIFFMRFMATRLLELVPLFKELPPPKPLTSADLVDDVDDEYSSLARSYGFLFGDLGIEYLDFILEFILGVEGFSPVNDAEALNNLRKTMMIHAQTEAAAQKQPPPQLTDGHLQELIQSNQLLAQQIVQMLLECAHSPRREVTNNTIPFFWRLKIALLVPVRWNEGGRNQSFGQQQQANGGLNPYQIRQKRKDVFKPAFQQLIPDIHRLMTYPLAWQPPTLTQPQQLTGDALDSIIKTRHMACGTLIDVSGIIGHESILEILTGDSVMGAQYQSFLQNPANAWRELEASLLCVECLATVIIHESDEPHHYGVPADEAFKQVGKTNLELLPKIFGLLLDPNSPLMKNQTLKYMTLKILSAYAPWFQHHAAAAPQQDYLPKVLNVIVQGLQDATVCKPAAQAMKHFCIDNRLRISESATYRDALLQVYSQVVVQPVQESRSSNATTLGLRLHDQLRVIAGVSSIVRAIPVDKQPQTPHAPLPNYINLLVTPMVDAIKVILTEAQQRNTNQLSEPVSTLLSQHLERLGESIAKLVDEDGDIGPKDNKESFVKALLQVYQQTLTPVLFTLMQHFTSVEGRMDKVCRVVKHVIRITKLEFLPQCLEPLMHHLHAAFNLYAHPCFLHLLGHCVDYFGFHPAFQPVIKQMLPAFMVKCLEAIPNLEAMKHNPDMTEDFFVTAGKVIVKCPHIFFELPNLPQIFQTAIAGLALHHRESISSITHFIAIFLTQALDTKEMDYQRGSAIVQQHQQKVHHLLLLHGPTLCDALIDGVAGGIPYELLSMYEGVFQDLLLVGPKQETQNWFIAALQKCPDTADPTKQQFLELIVTCHKYNIREAIKRFGAACRIKKELLTKK